MGMLMEKYEMTEEDIKLQFITPAIESAGWDRSSQIKMEYNFTAETLLNAGVGSVPTISSTIVRTFRLPL